ncbi:Fe/S biogenesis protein NfuA [compost metagenome]
MHVQEVVAALDALSRDRELRDRLQEARAIAKGPIESPFATARLAEARMAELREGHDDGTVDREQVMGVLDMLRPFMQADGGDVELAGIDAGIVKVRLQGACGTCPSSTVTLRMGIEAQLKQRVPGVLGVEAVF